MDTIDAASLALREPQHGWLGLRLQLGSFVIECEASNVLNDPLDELIDVVESLSSSPPHVSSRVCLWLEPEGYAIDFVDDLSSNRCLIRVSYDEHSCPPMRHHPTRLLFEGHGDVTMVRDALSSALVEFVNTVDDASLKAWACGRSYFPRLAGLQRRSTWKR